MPFMLATTIVRRAACLILLVEPSIKSEPVPEKQEGPVTVVVANSYQQEVIDNDKDVLLEFYAPWCGHCKA